jgi:hypothetical protein
MTDYKKLGRILDSADQQKLDELINISTEPLISQYDKQFIRHGFIEVKNNKYILKMGTDARAVFQITKKIGLDEINWLLDIIKKLLSDETEQDEIENLKKNEDLLRDRSMIEQLQYDKISEGHKKLVGELYKNIDELKEDNKNLSKQIADLNDKPSNLRKKGLM